MLEPGLGADLPLEALDAERGAQLGVEHLERDAAAVAEVLGEVDGRGRAAADLPLDPVASGEGFVERGPLRVGHCAAWSASRASAARWKRSAGRRARQRATKRSSAGGTLSRSELTAGAAWVSLRLSTTARLLPPNGGSPASISNTMQPTL